MKILQCLLIFLAFIFSLSSCSKIEKHNPNNYYQMMGEMSFGTKYLDDFLQFSTSDVVTAQFFKKRFFSTYWYELEFRVIDRIIGDAPDTFFVYVQNATSRNGAPFLSYNFDIDPTYLLILSNLSRFSAISNFNVKRTSHAMQNVNRSI